MEHRTCGELIEKVHVNRGGSRENLHWVQSKGERSEPKKGGGFGGTPPGKFLRPRPSDWLKTLFREKVL